MPTALRAIENHCTINRHATPTGCNTAPNPDVYVISRDGSGNTVHSEPADNIYLGTHGLSTGGYETVVFDEKCVSHFTLARRIESIKIDNLTRFACHNDVSVKSEKIDGNVVAMTSFSWS